MTETRDDGEMPLRNPVPPVLVLDPRDGNPHEDEDPVGKPDSPRQLALGFAFGLVFGFLLQKGGVAKYEVLLGQFLLTDFTVIKVMMTAVIVGMAGVFGLHALGLVKLHVKPTRHASNVVGGLLFGVGMALLGYCPGTGAAALGEGRLDALGGIAGLMVGSYVYAEASDRISATIHAIGNRGRIELPDLLHVRRGPFLAVFLPLLLIGLVALHLVTT
jgi:hypothetical protein